MTCPTVTNRFVEIINDALVLAGKLTPGQVATAGDMSFSLRLLNNIQGLWSGQTQYLFYVNTVFHTVIESKLVYTISTDTSSDIVANAFEDISSLNYSVGEIDYGCQYLPLKAFNLIPIKNIVAYPTNWTYETFGTYTQLRIYPQPQVDMVLRINGKQILSDVGLFDSSAVIAPFGILPLTYTLAKHMINFGRGNAQPNFYTTCDRIMSEFISANRQDPSYEISPPFGSSKSGTAYGGGGPF